jgi:GTP-binding protein EngB required for normal cell division
MTLDTQLDALRDLQELGAGRLPDTQLAEIDALLHRAASRRALSAEHTVVGLFGATGSGKSSLLNALVGEPIARSHVRRPTTSEPLAVSWDPAGASALLDWLEVRDRHSRQVPIDARADQLILLDLPDFDSVQLEHRATAERLAGQVDALVWVVDPQKYADAVLHTDFLSAHARHGAVTIVVLNQIDLLPNGEVSRVMESLRGLLAADGLGGVRMLATSATTGEGVDALRAAIGDLAEARVAQSARLAADVSALASAVPAPGTTTRGSKGDAKSKSRELTARLGDAAGVDVVADAVAGSYRKRSGQATGWPIVSWVLRFRADPLTRLGLRPNERVARDPELHRSSLPAMNASAKAKVSLAVRGYAEAVSDGLTDQWRAGIREVGLRAVDILPAKLDLAITRTSLPTKGSWWWTVFAILQWIAVVAALSGVLWLLVIALVPPLAMLLPPVPEVEGWPLTTLLIGGGVLLGILLGLLGAAVGAAAGSARRRRARRALHRQIELVSNEVVVQPVEAELERVRRFDAALAAARA